MTWLLSSIKPTDANPGILDDNRTHQWEGVANCSSDCNLFVTRIIGVHRIGSVVCFLVPWVIIRTEIKNEKCWDSI